VSDQILITLLIVLILLVLVIVGVLIVLVWKMTTQNQTVPKTAQPTNETPKKRKLSAVEPDPTIENCYLHPEIQARGICALSSHPICERCLREDDGVIVAAEYFRLYLENKWVPLETILTTPETTEASAHLYEFKKELWEKNETPTFISTHYKINVADDFIESHVSLNVRENEHSLLYDRLQQKKTGRKFYDKKI